MSRVKGSFQKRIFCMEISKFIHRVLKFPCQPAPISPPKRMTRLRHLLKKLKSFQKVFHQLINIKYLFAKYLWETLNVEIYFNEV